MLPVAEKSTCRHCAKALLPTQREFCCGGCEAVFRVLQEQGLSHFYDLQRSTGNLAISRPVPLPANGSRPFASWNDSAFKTRFLQNGKFKVYLEGVHCLGCLWLIENLPTRAPGLMSARLDLGKSVAYFDSSPSLNLESLGNELLSYGYTPVPLEPESGGEALARKQSRKEMIRVAVAALAASNIMLSAIPLYAGVDAGLKSLFTTLSAILFVPVLFFAAVPFFENSWSSIKRKNPSIDLPIALAIFGGGFFSFWNLFHGSDEIYFDSLAMIIALLLGVRMLLRRMQAAALASPEKRLESSTVGRREPDGTLKFIPAAAVKVGDWIELTDEQTIPFDGILRCPRAEVDSAILTGEPAPRRTSWGESVYAGTSIFGNSLVVEVTAKGSDTRLSSILDQARSASSQGTRWSEISDRVGRYFVAGVFVVILGIVALRWGLGATETFRRILAVSVVSCPCAFAFAVPLAFVLGRRRLASNGVFVGDPTSLERLAGVNYVLLDKTGTLTEGELQVTSWHWRREDVEMEKAVFAIEKLSRHPVARAIVRNLSGKLPLSEKTAVEDFKEFVGYGVEGTVGGRRYQIRASQDKFSNHETRVEIRLLHGDVWLLEGECALQDKLRTDSKAAVSALKQLGLDPWLLSGDAEGPVLRVAQEVGIPEKSACARLSPEQKANVAVSLDKTLMVGDGANDSIALSMADVGVAVSGGVEYSLRSADLYLSEPGVMPVVKLVRFSRKMRSVIRGNLVLSVAFNGVAISLAATGHLSPLFAAVFMPVSSLSVLIFTALGMRGGKC